MAGKALKALQLPRKHLIQKVGGGGKKYKHYRIELYTYFKSNIRQQMYIIHLELLCYSDGTTLKHLSL